MRKARDTAHFCCLRSFEGVCACLYPCNSCLKGFDIALCVLVPCCGSADTHLLLVSVRCAANNNEKEKGENSTCFFAFAWLATVCACLRNKYTRKTTSFMTAITAMQTVTSSFHQFTHALASLFPFLSLF